jgi:NAD(P)-dependent dehydrogenase (short-subunit alcohol dehydrogenase family)
MKRDLSGLPIVITGASSGIGRATAVACAAAGMPVVIAARRADRLHEVVGEIEQASPAGKAGGRAVAVECDVADAASCRRAVEVCAERFGSVYAVFANAGIAVNRAVHEMPMEEMCRVFGVNFFGTLEVIAAALPHMRAAGRGHVLVCSSCLARMPMVNLGAYTATKAAQHHVARAMRLELAPLGVHVSSVHPIGTRTELFEAAEKLSGPGSGNSIERGVKPGPPEAFMQDASFVAACIVRCLRREKPEAEVWPGISAKVLRLAMAGLSVWPSLGDRVMRMADRRR